MGKKIAAVALCAALALPALAQDTPDALAVAGLSARDDGFLQTTPAEPRKNPMGSVAMTALYGGGAGAIVGLGVGLIEGGNYARDVTVGAGLGVLVGAAVGGIMAYSDQKPLRVARDGLGTLARDRDLQRRMTASTGYAVRW